MDREEWNHVQLIFHDALELSGGEREAFLTVAAKNDEKVVREVRSFLKAFESGGDRLERPVAEIDREFFEPELDKTLLTGREINGYRIGKCLGNGGMGDVYYAEDLALNRPVALKFLSSEFHKDDAAKSQLKREAKSLAVVDHPNICQVHTLAEADEHHFIVMEYVDGESLATLIKDRRLDAANAFDVGLQIVKAIAAAHRLGIIHCDIKPGNVIVIADGTAKVLDFGLAKVVRGAGRPTSPADQITQAAQAIQLGTVAYMSPEQHIGSRLDHASDVFSLGTLLYELNVGDHPFEREDTQQTKEAILDGAVSFDTPAAKLIRPGLKRVLKRCFEPEPEKRYSDADCLLWDLEHLQRSWVTAKALKFFPYVAALLFVIALTSALYYFRNDKIYKVAIVPFANETADASLDYLSDGVPENLADRMEGARGFSVVPYSKLRDLSGRGVEPSQVGKSVKADLVVTGRIYRINASLAVETNLIDANDGALLRRSETQLRADGIQTAEDIILEKLFADLDIWPFEPIEGADKRPGKTKIQEAFRQYLIGRNHWRKRDKANIELAIAAYQRAIDLDPRYARAWAGMAECWVLMSSVAYGSVSPKDAFAKARAAARQGLDIDPNDSEARTALGVVLTKHDWKWVEAEAEYRRAIADNPNYAGAYYWLSGLLGITGRTEESITTAEKARELDPFSPLVEYNLSRSYYFARNWEKSLEVLNRLSDADKQDTRFLYQSGLILLQMGRYEEALRSFQLVAERNKMLAAAAMGQTLAKMGRTREARELVTELETSASKTYVPPQELAIIYIGLNEKELAFKNLRAAYQERYGSLSALKVEPLFDGIRTDPRFHSLLVEMRLN